MSHGLSNFYLWYSKCDLQKTIGEKSQPILQSEKTRLRLKIYAINRIDEQDLCKYLHIKLNQFWSIILMIWTFSPCELKNCTEFILSQEYCWHFQCVSRGVDIHNFSSAQRCENLYWQQEMPAISFEVRKNKWWKHDSRKIRSKKFLWIENREHVMMWTRKDWYNQDSSCGNVALWFIIVFQRCHRVQLRSCYLTQFLQWQMQQIIYTECKRL